MARKAKGSGFKMRSGNTTSFKKMGNSSPTKFNWDSYFAGNAQVDDDLATDRLHSRPNRIAEFRRKNPGYKPGKKNKTPEDLLLHFQSAGFNFKTPQEAVEYKRNLDLSKARGGNRGRVVYSTNPQDKGSMWGTTRKFGTGQDFRNDDPRLTS